MSAPAAPPPPTPPHQRPAAATGPPRIHTGELVSALSAVLLLPIMFVLQWFGTVGLPRSRRSGLETAVSAWHILTATRWVMLLAIVVALGSVVLHATQRGHGTKTDTSVAVASIGTLTALLLGYRVLIDLPDPSSVVDIKIGAYLGLLATIGIALGGYDSIREQRLRRVRVARRARRPDGLASRREAR